MDVSGRETDAIRVMLSSAELSVVRNALNEIANGPDAIDDWEFNTRIGVNRIAVTALLERLSELEKS